MTIAIVGQALMLLTLAACIFGMAASARAARTLAATPAGGSSGEGACAYAWEAAGYRATRVVLGAAAGGCLLLFAALARGDFSLSYVAGRTSSDLPLHFRLSALWSGQEGSLLLWLAVLATFAVLMTRRSVRTEANRPMLAWANAVILATCAFFALLVAVVARPFALAPSLAADGAGMSPSLQNYWMALHPPTLYVGYVGVAVPFALVMGAMLARRSDDAWVVLTRRWTLVAWAGLSLGLLFGGRWAYEEIGWGGYWAWDPVENAALMPWLTATAFLHSIRVQERRGMMRYWNVVLVVLTFALSIFGTFLTRSGVLSSVHSFVSSDVGWWFIGFLGISIAGSLVVLYRSRDLLRARHDIETVVSREATFLFNNVLLVSIALMVLWGVLYPILTAAFAGERVSLQAPWYNFFIAVFGLPLLVLMAIGPVVAWHRSTLRRVVHGLVAPFVAAVATGVVAVALGASSSWPGVAAISLGAFVVAGIVAEFARGIAARRRHDPVVSPARALRELFGRNRRRYGGYVSHAGVGLLAIAIAGSSAYTREVQQVLAPGDTVRNGRYELTYEAADRRREATSMQTRARFSVRKDGRDAGTIEAGKNFYPASGEISNEVGIRPSLRTGEDLFVVVDRLAEDGAVTVKVIINPLVNLLWAAGLVIVAGGLVAAWPQRRDDGTARTVEAEALPAPIVSRGPTASPQPSPVGAGALAGRTPATAPTEGAS